MKSSLFKCNNRPPNRDDYPTFDQWDQAMTEWLEHGRSVDRAILAATILAGVLALVLIVRFMLG